MFFQHISEVPNISSEKKKKQNIEDITTNISAVLYQTASSFIPKETNEKTNEKSNKKSTPKEVKKKPYKKNIVEEEIIQTENSDILFINEQIKKKLMAKISTLDEMKQDLSALLWILNNSNSPIDKIQANKERDILRRRMQDVEGGFEYALYILKTSDMLEEYKILVAETTNTKSFMKDVGAPKDAAKNFRKSQIISDFLRIAKQYISLENVNLKKIMICNACYSNNLKESDDSSIFHCQECGNQVEVLDDAPTFKDAERVNMSSRYTYTCKGHFSESMNRFEGKQNTEISEEVIEILKKEMKLHGLDSTNFTKDHLYLFLSENKLSDFYADINLIYFLITKINPPDITKYRSELLEMFEQLEEAYREVKSDDRLNSLNVNWKLYKLLQLLDYPCKKDDFFCLKTPTKQGEHEEKWYDMIEYLKGKYPKAKTSSGKPRWRHIRTL